MSTTNIPGYHLLNAEEIELYYNHINLPSQYRHDPASGAARDPEKALPWLSALIRHHAAAIPFENLTMHYDRSHIVTLAHDYAFDKAIKKKTEDGRACNRGGYCLETGGLLLCILRSLNFDVYPTGGRINKQYADPTSPPYYSSFGHLVNLVRVGNKTYFADIGMTLGMPARAIPLEPESANELHNWGNFSMRLYKGKIAEHTSSQEVWIYEAKFSERSQWQPILCFTEVEFIQDDFERMNYYINTSRRYWMGSRLIVSKLILDNDEEGSVIGLATLTGNIVKRSVRGEREAVTCKTEEERIAALEKYFEIRLTREERRGISDLASALPGADMYAQ